MNLKSKPGKKNVSLCKDVQPFTQQAFDSKMWTAERLYSIVRVKGVNLSFFVGENFFVHISFAYYGVYSNNQQIVIFIE